MKICKRCGTTLPDKTKFCTVCGNKVKSNNKRNVLLGIIGFFIVMGVFSTLGKQSEEGKTPGSNSVTSGNITIEEVDISRHNRLTQELLAEYGKYMAGEKVVTVITVASKSGNSIKANSEGNLNINYTVSCEFDNKEKISGVKEDMILTIAGTVKEEASFLSQVTIENCAIIGKDEMLEKIKGAEAQERQMCEEFKSAYENKIAIGLKAEKDEYILSCENLDYSSVERNPDTYKGTHVKIDGTVVQVTEGFLNSVTLRVDCDGNTWWVTYTREDGSERILEDDKITCYGECTGVTSYSNAFGVQITIPSMEMKYYD